MNGTSHVRDRRGQFERDYDGTSSTLRDARKDVVGWLLDSGFDGDLQDRAALVVSELATNALQASPGSAYGVKLRRAGDRSAILAVTSHTDFKRPPPREHWGPASTCAARGRGLMIVEAVADGVEVDLPGQDTVVVTATFRSVSPLRAV
ncbi:MAG TPA: ATP-binding protein [Acidimicrobiia bacterium]|nr:ATP-binding protein [Acidimicrobiia bacterium]